MSIACVRPGQWPMNWSGSLGQWEEMVSAVAVACGLPAALDECDWTQLSGWWRAVDLLRWPFLCSTHWPKHGKKRWFCTKLLMLFCFLSWAVSFLEIPLTLKGHKDHILCIWTHMSFSDSPCCTRSEASVNNNNKERGDYSGFFH